MLDPETGAHQVSSDDLRSDNDALQNLVDDAVMDNCVSADTDFSVNYRRLDLRAPFILIAATDGCFGYVPSPMHFEHLILSHLQGSTSVDAWREGLRSSVEAVAGDDATMALLAVGGDVDTLRSLFRPRLEHLRSTYIDPIDDEQMRKTAQRADELKQRRVALRSQLWTRYKPGYERYLAASPPPAGTAGEDSATGEDSTPGAHAADDAVTPSAVVEVEIDVSDEKGTP